MNKEDYKRELEAASAAYKLLLQRGRSSHVPLSDYVKASEQVLEKERALCHATGDQYAIPLDLGFNPDAAVSAPFLLQTDGVSILTFNAVKIAANDSARTVGTAIIEFDLCFWTSFGYPNDEALDGHPLSGCGLSAYRIFDVRNSHWLQRMNEQNRVSFPNWKGYDTKHLIFTFHDSTFECLCRDIKSSSFSTAKYSEIFSEVSKKVLERHSNEL